MRPNLNKINNWILAKSKKNVKVFVSNSVYRMCIISSLVANDSVQKSINRVK